MDRMCTTTPYTINLTHARIHMLDAWGLWILFCKYQGSTLFETGGVDIRTIQIRVTNRQGWIQSGWGGGGGGGLSLLT